MYVKFFQWMQYVYGVPKGAKSCIMVYTIINYGIYHNTIINYGIYLKDLYSTAPKRGSVFIGLMTPDGAIWSRYQRTVLMR